MKKIVKVRAPIGFSWKIIEGPSLVRVILVYKSNGRKIGEVSLHKQEDDVFETHSNLDEKHHGRGFGAKLYARAIQWCLQNKHKVRSSGCTSSLAQRVWRGKTIRKFFRIKTEHRIYGSNQRDPDDDIFIALPKYNRVRA